MRLTSNIHGNEIAGRILVQYFVKMVCLLWSKKKTTHPHFKKFFLYLPKTRIHILMSANPDGYDTFVKSYAQNASAADILYFLGRNNSNNVDLNRSFYVDPSLQRTDQHVGVRYPAQKMFPSPNRTVWSQEIEIQMIQNWMFSNDFLLAASFHGGQRLATVPFDASDVLRRGRTASPSSQIDVSMEIAKVYMKRFSYTGCGNSFDPRLDKGVINGAAWYSFKGSECSNFFIFHRHENTINMKIEEYIVRSYELYRNWLQSCSLNDRTSDESEFSDPT